MFGSSVKTKSLREWWRSLLTKEKREMIKKCICLTLLCAGLFSAGRSSWGREVSEVLREADFQGGLAVCIGCDEVGLLTGLGAMEPVLVQAVDTDARKIAEVRAVLRAREMYGKVSIVVFDGRNLPYADNLVNLIVADGDCDVPEEEILRALAPRGTALIGEKKLTKPIPPEVDDWTHFLYDASNNAVSKDRAVAPPTGMQWVAAPKFSRSHEQLASVSGVVSAGGRLFSIEDHGPIESVAFPPKWFLVARDAYNGITLWKREIKEEEWEWHLHLFRSGPFHLARRLVAVGDRVYVTLGFGRPIAVLDAATGETIKTLSGTKGADEFVHVGKQLLVYVGHSGRDDVSGEKVKGKKDSKPTGKKATGPKGTSSGKQQKLLALNAETGEIAWEKTISSIIHSTLCSGDGRVYYQEGGSVVASSLEDGSELWRSESLYVRKGNFVPPVVVACGDTVLWANGVDPRDIKRYGKGMLAGLDAKTGETLWRGTSERNCAAPPDVLISDGLLWTGKLLLHTQDGITEGLDLRTGKVERTRKPDKETYNVGMPHHRCYRNKAAGDWLILGRAGVEFQNVKTGEIFPHHWVRGTCQYGILPANGLLHVPPHACACYLTAKINGFNALHSRLPEEPDKAPTLVRGPAFDEVQEGASGAVAASDWPTYRHDAERSGRASTLVPSDLKRVWKADVGGKLTAMTIAGNLCFVADNESHTVHALDVGKGEKCWSFTASGRIDSPPTIADGLAVFGSRDGHVYALRAEDGALVWRFRAASTDRRVVSYGQVESPWPVHGSVLVQDGVASFSAGRSSFLDGGIRLFRLALKSGHVLAETTVYTPDPQTHRLKGMTVKGFDMPGTHSEILVSDGENICLQQMCFDADLKPAEAKPHLFSPTGLLDDNWWHRAYWLYGKDFASGWTYWALNGNLAPAGRLLAFDETDVYGFGRRQFANCARGRGNSWALQEAYCLFSTPRNAGKSVPMGRMGRYPKTGPRQFNWAEDSPVRAGALVLTGEHLFAAGPPNFGNSSPEAFSSYKGEKGAKLVAVATQDGAIRSELDLPAVPVLDGMAAAGGRLYLSLNDGTVICLGNDI